MHLGRPSPSAESVAAARMHLTRRGVIDDVYAERFVRPAKRIAINRLPSLRGPARGISWIAARTHFFDEVITESLDRGIRQVVIVVAGYDCRAWRLARKGVRYIEVDLPATQARKMALAPSGGPEYVAADLTMSGLPDVLASHLSIREPVVLICEGLTYYLAELDVRSVLSQLAGIAAEGSCLGVDFATSQRAPLTWRPAAAATRLWQRWTREPLRFQLHSDDASALLADCAWSVAEVLTHADLHALYLRDANVSDPPSIGSYVCRATRQ